MSRPAPVLADAWAQLVRRDGFAEIVMLSHAELVAVGADAVNPVDPADRQLLTTFEKLEEADQARAVAAAKARTFDDDAVTLIKTVSSDPMFRGTWMQTPPWFEPLDRSKVVRLFGMDLPDGTPGVLESTVDLTTSRFAFRVRTLANEAASLAARCFADDPPAPAESDAGWTDENGGGLVQLTFVWPWRRGTRVTSWRITRTSSDSAKAFIQLRRDHGLKRAKDITLDEAGIAERLRDTLTHIAAEGARSR